MAYPLDKYTLHKFTENDDGNFNDLAIRALASRFRDAARKRIPFVAYGTNNWEIGRAVNDWLCAEHNMDPAQADAVTITALVGMLSQDADPDGAAVCELLHRVPERWAEYQPDTLSDAEGKALFLLVAAGMVERRGRLRYHLFNHPVAFEATWTATGEYGFAEAMDPLIASMWPTWKAAYTEWRAGDTATAPNGVCESLGPDEWRLTDQGVLAQADLKAGNTRTVLSFVLKRGFFDGSPRLMPDGRISQREPVRGTGQLVSMRKVPADSPDTAGVNIKNWPEGAAAIAAVIEALNQRSGGTQDPPPAAAGASRTDARPEPAIDDDSHLAPAKLAELFRVPADRLRTRLNRWRETNHSGWIENPDRAPRQAKYLYRVGTVRPIIQELRATSQATSERPAKKK